MKAKVQFIGSLAMINAYLIAFAYGFNSKPVPVIDESLPPLPKSAAAPPATKSESNAAAKENVAKETAGKETAGKETAGKAKSKSKTKSGSPPKSKSTSQSKSKTKKS
jgi:hypothetical protein